MESSLPLSAGTAKASTKKAEDASDVALPLQLAPARAHAHQGAGRAGAGETAQQQQQQQQPVAFAAVFDGHGGRQAAHHCRDTMRTEVARALGEALAGVGGSVAVAAPAAGAAAFTATHASFEAGGAPPSGATATVCVACAGGVRRTRPERGSCEWGWEAFEGGTTLSVCNVGDSHAFLDSGSAVLACSADHRLDTSARERERVRREGGAVGRSSLEEGGKGVGPLRAWPGGLAMSRTVGDLCAPQVIAQPECRQVWVPPGCAARLILASDGLWDGVAPKVAAKLVRAKGAPSAAAALVQAAKKARGMRDDITVVVLDVLPEAATDADAKPASPFAGGGLPWRAVVVDPDSPGASVSSVLGANGQPAAQVPAQVPAQEAPPPGARALADAADADVTVAPAAPADQLSPSAVAALAEAQGLPVGVVLGSAGIGADVAGAGDDDGGWTDVPVRRPHRPRKQETAQATAAATPGTGEGADGEGVGAQPKPRGIKKKGDRQAAPEAAKGAGGNRARQQQQQQQQQQRTGKAKGKGDGMRGRQQPKQKRSGGTGDASGGGNPAAASEGVGALQVEGGERGRTGKGKDKGAQPQPQGEGASDASQQQHERQQKRQRPAKDKPNKAKGQQPRQRGQHGERAPPSQLPQLDRSADGVRTPPDAGIAVGGSVSLDCTRSPVSPLHSGTVFAGEGGGPDGRRGGGRGRGRGRGRGGGRGRGRGDGRGRGRAHGGGKQRAHQTSAASAQAA